MNAVTASEPWEGKVIEGKYPLLEILGSGPHGPVFRSEFSGANGRENAAIKLIPEETGSADFQLSRLRSAMELSHPHLLRIFAVGQCQIRGKPTIYVVTEYAEENLAQVLPSRTLTSGEAEKMLPPLIEALSYLHGKGFAHGRVQPSNVMAAGESLKLSSDSVNRIDDAPAQSQKNKSRFAAPELAKNNPTADIWSLGATLVAALATESRGEPSEQQLTLVPNSIPEPFRRIARECLRPNPSDRCTLEQIKVWLPPSAAAMQEKSGVLITPRRRTFNAIIPILTLVVLSGIVWTWRALRLKAVNQTETVDIAVPSQPSQSQPAATTQGETLPGAVAERVLPNVSQSARNTIQGKIRVAVRVNVDATGTVTDAKLASAGPSKYFANQALQSARRWKFNPPQIDGQPAPSTWLLKYQFGRSGTDVTPSETH